MKRCANKKLSVIIVMIVSIYLIFCGCGKKGPPVPPRLEKPPAIEDLSYRLDGSSLESFDASLEKVRRHTSTDSYETLTNAIDYLMVYDLAAQRDRARLASRLDGLNGYEVIDLVGWRKP